MNLDLIDNQVTHVNLQSRIQFHPIWALRIKTEDRRQELKEDNKEIILILITSHLLWLNRINLKAIILDLCYNGMISLSEEVPHQWWLNLQQIWKLIEVLIIKINSLLHRLNSSRIKRSQVLLFPAEFKEVVVLIHIERFKMVNQALLSPLGNKTKNL